jgi:hypothetical protein
MEAQGTRPGRTPRRRCGAAARVSSLIAALLILPLSLADAVNADPAEEAEAIGATPPRLSYAEGQASFWRPGSRDWAPAQVNTPLSPGDQLYTGNRGNLELQVGGRAFVRAWGDTHVGFSNQEPDFLQLEVTSGHLSVDLRSVDPGHTVEVDTPHAAFTIEHPGYYRIDVTPARTAFITRRAGRATATPAGGQAIAIAPSEEIVLEGAATPGGTTSGLPTPGETPPTAQVQSYVAPPLDVWDRWNYARTEELLDAVSARYVPPSVYGVDDLDHHGNWRVVPTYGAVWVPEAVPVGWAPYSTGRWIWDPHFGWTWVDTMPWGWAPFHYGRWVFVDSFWAWAPGPLIARPVYAPALVAFLGGPRVSVAIVGPALGWVALGWGEPLVPWWGPSVFIGRPWWGGWGGPRVVNNVVINRTTIVNVTNITTYRNLTVPTAVVAVRQEQFGRVPVADARLGQVDARQLRPVHGPLPVAPTAASFVAASGRAVRPPEQTVARRVVATRPPTAGAAPVAPEPGPRAERQTPAAPMPSASAQSPAAVTPLAKGQPAASARGSRPDSAPGAARVPSRPAPHIVLVPPTTPQDAMIPPAAPRSGPAPTPAVANNAPSPTPAAPLRPNPPVSPAPAPSRPPFAATGPERPKPPLPPRFDLRGAEVAPGRARSAPPPSPAGASPTPAVQQRAGSESVSRPRSPVSPSAQATLPRVEGMRALGRPLPGEPANRLYPGRGEPQARRPEKKPAPEGHGGAAPSPSK